VRRAKDVVEAGGVLHGLSPVRSAHTTVDGSIVDDVASDARWLVALLDNISEVVTVLDRNGKMRFLSGSTLRLLGRDAADRIGGSIFDFVHPDDTGRVAETFMRALATPGPIEPFDVRMLHEDGDYHVFEVRANSMLDDPVVRGIVVSSRDLGDRRELEDTLRQTEGRFEQVFENAAVGANIVDTNGQFLRVNTAYCRMLGTTAPDLMTRTIFDVSLPEDVDRTRVAFARLLASETDEYTIEKRLLRADGQTVWARIGASVVRDGNGEPLYAIGLAIDTTETHALTEQLAHAASHDHLTGLASRSVLDDHLQRTRASAARSGDLVAVLAIDLDEFKQINDRFGHLAGDDVLVEVAHRLEALVRAEDLIVRYGGDEFIIVLRPGADIELVKLIAQRVVDALAEPMNVLGTTTRIGASVGIAIVWPDAGEGDDVLARADAATYEAKQRGKGRYALFDELHRITRPTASSPHPHSRTV
jgi:diguanylate cyclase (GGDEF)-like protein/PAS domain S-box-containing protein